MSVQFIPIVLAVGEARTINTVGKVFVCDASTDIFAIRFDNSAELTFSSKRVYGSSTSGLFSRVTIRNTGLVVNTILYAISNDDIKIEQAVSSVIATITVAASKNAPTTAVGFNTTISGLDIFNGVTGGGRKSFSVFNREASGSGNNINVLGSNGVVMHVVEPRQSYVVETGGLITLTAAGAYAYSACEVNYVS